MTKLSQTVVTHVQSFIDTFPVTSLGQSILKVYPKTTLSTRELQLFWRYHGHFPQEFVQAVINSLPENYQFVSYDHLLNNVTVIHN